MHFRPKISSQFHWREVYNQIIETCHVLPISPVFFFLLVFLLFTISIFGCLHLKFYTLEALCISECVFHSIPTILMCVFFLSFYLSLFLLFRFFRLFLLLLKWLLGKITKCFSFSFLYFFIFVDNVYFVSILSIDGFLLLLLFSTAVFCCLLLLLLLLLLMMFPLRVLLSTPLYRIISYCIKKKEKKNTQSHTAKI